MRACCLSNYSSSVQAVPRSVHKRCALSFSFLPLWAFHRGAPQSEELDTWQNIHPYNPLAGYTECPDSSRTATTPSGKMSIARSSVREPRRQLHVRCGLRFAANRIQSNRNIILVRHISHGLRALNIVNRGVTRYLQDTSKQGVVILVCYIECCRIIPMVGSRDIEIRASRLKTDEIRESRVPDSIPSRPGAQFFADSVRSLEFPEPARGQYRHGTGP